MEDTTDLSAFVMASYNAGPGHVIDAIEKYLPFELIKIHHEPDGTFPNGIPNPLLPDNRHHIIIGTGKVSGDRDTVGG